MQNPPTRLRAFTVLELLVVIAILLFVIAVLQPTTTHRRKAASIVCMSNQRQIVTGFLMSAADHGDAFPWQRPAINGGTLEFISTGHAVPHFQTISNYSQATLFVCPTDKGRSASSNYANLTSRNVSYFINADATVTNSTFATVLTGDRNLQADGLPVPPGLFTFKPGLQMGWTQELHSNPQNPGVLGFADGHGETILSNRLTSILTRSATGSSRLVVP